MTEKERIAFIKDKIVPIFDGLMLSDITNILVLINQHELEQYLRISVISSVLQGTTRPRNGQGKK